MGEAELELRVRPAVEMGPVIGLPEAAQTPEVRLVAVAKERFGPLGEQLAPVGVAKWGYELQEEQPAVVGEHD